MKLKGVTPRMREVWERLAGGKTAKEIAAESRRTVERHIERLHEHLQVKNLADITREAVRQGIITIEVQNDGRTEH